MQPLEAMLTVSYNKCEAGSLDAQVVVYLCLVQQLEVMLTLSYNRSGSGPNSLSLQLPPPTRQFITATRHVGIAVGEEREGKSLPGTCAAPLPCSVLGIESRVFTY